MTQPDLSIEVGTAMSPHLTIGRAGYDRSDRPVMGSSCSITEERTLLDVLVPLAFRHCVTDLSTEHLTDSEKAKIDRFVYTYVEAYYQSKESVGEQRLLDDYAHLVS
jgi:hypothetical protein